MSITGELIKFGGLFGLTLGSTVSLFMASRAFSLLYKLGDMKEEFEELWERNDVSGLYDGTLTNLSYVHKAVRRQMEATEEVDRYLLERALKQAKEGSSVLGGREGHMYFAASEKLQELKAEARRAGKL